MNITVIEKTCSRCSHTWIPRKDRPAVCPKCHSHLWDTNGTQPRDGRVPLVIVVDQELLEAIDRKAARSRFPDRESWLVWALSDAVRDRHKKTA